MNSTHTQTPSVVLVPGAFAGAWMWNDVADQLAQADIRTQVIELPTYGEQAQDKTFADDVAEVTRVLDGADSVVLVAHSYGGSVITAAASGPHAAVRELVYVAGAAPGTGDSMAGVTAAAAQAAGGGEGEDAPGPVARDDGLMVFPPEIARQALFNDCSEQRAEEGLRGLRPQSFAGVDQAIGTAAWTEIRSVYVRGTDDLVPRALAPDFLERCEQVIDLPTGHCPQWSHPELVSELIRARVGAADGR